MNREESISWLEGIKEKYIHGGDEKFEECRKTAIDMAIEALKQPEIKWIPTSERLPEENGFYLVSGGGYIPWTAELITNRRTGLRGWSSKEVMANVEAWMPLPEPYETH